MQCRTCQHENPAGAKFCVECASRLTPDCPACGAAVPSRAKFCPECAAPLTTKPHLAPAPPSPSAPTAAAVDGARRQLTVLFCDLVGSTELSTQLDPEEWRDVVAQYHSVVAKTVEKFGGYVVKYLGDGLLVLFGYPYAHEDEAERAVRGATGDRRASALRRLSLRSRRAAAHRSGAPSAGSMPAEGIKVG